MRAAHLHIINVATPGRTWCKHYQPPVRMVTAAVAASLATRHGIDTRLIICARCVRGLDTSPYPDDQEYAADLLSWESRGGQ